MWLFFFSKNLSLGVEMSSWLSTTAFSEWDCQGSLGWGVWFFCLSGVNFQTLSTFGACFSLSLVCSSSTFIFREMSWLLSLWNLSWAALGGRTCWRNWIGGVHSGIICSLVASQIASMLDLVQTLAAVAFVFLPAPLSPLRHWSSDLCNLPSKACNMPHTISILKSTHLVLFGKRLLIGHLESPPDRGCGHVGVPHLHW